MQFAALCFLAFNIVVYCCKASFCIHIDCVCVYVRFTVTQRMHSLSNQVYEVPQLVLMSSWTTAVINAVAWQQEHAQTWWRMMWASCSPDHRTHTVASVPAQGLLCSWTEVLTRPDSFKHQQRHFTVIRLICSSTVHHEPQSDWVVNATSGSESMVMCWKKK